MAQITTLINVEVSCVTTWSVHFNWTKPRNDHALQKPFRCSWAFYSTTHPWFVLTFRYTRPVHMFEATYNIETMFPLIDGHLCVRSSFWFGILLIYWGEESTVSEVFIAAPWTQPPGHKKDCPFIGSQFLFYFSLSSTTCVICSYI